MISKLAILSCRLWHDALIEVVDYLPVEERVPTRHHLLLQGRSVHFAEVNLTLNNRYFAIKPLDYNPLPLIVSLACLK